jgi:hypothetical protein
MADADLDMMIRKLAKQQHKTLMAAVKKRRDRYAALAAKAKDTGTRQRYRQLARDAAEIGAATVKRLQMSADNAADSYARAMRQTLAAATDKAARAPREPALPAGGPAKKTRAGKTVAKTGK